MKLHIYITVTTIVLISIISCTDFINVSTHTISGSVELCSSGFDGATLTLHSPEHGSVSIESDGYGDYTFTDVWDGTYTLTACKKGYTFSPEKRTVTVSGGNVEFQDFLTELSWSKIFGESDLESKGYSINPTSDCGYIICGHKNSDITGTENPDLWVLKIDMYGNREWEFLEESVGDDSGYMARETASGEYLVIGYHTNNDDQNMVLMKLRVNTDPNTGQGVPAKAWEKSLGGSESDSGRSFVQLKDDNAFIVAGTTGSESLDLGDMWIMKLDESGVLYDNDPVWNQTFGVYKNERVNAIIQERTESNDCFLIAGGSVDTDGSILSNVLKIDANFMEEWWFQYSAHNDDGSIAVISEIENIQSAYDGGYITAGYSSNTSDLSSYKDFWVMRLDASGEKKWEKVLDRGYDEGATSVIETSDHGCLVAGYIYIEEKANYDFWLIKFNETGEIEWDRQFERIDGSDDRIAALVQTLDGGYIILGNTQNFYGQYHVWIMKFNRHGEIVYSDNK